MIEEDEVEPPPSRIPALFFGLALGALITFIIMLVEGKEKYIPKDQAAAYLAERGYAVINSQDEKSLRTRPEACLTSDVCANQVEVNRRLKMRFQSLEANNLRLIRERDEKKAQAEGLMQRLTLDWSFEIDPNNPGSYRCIAGETKVGTWNNCTADGSCGNPDLIDALCVYRNRDWITGP